MKLTMKFFLSLLIGYGTVSASAANTVHARIVGQLLNAHGDVSIKRDGKVAVATVQTGETLREGDIIAVGKGATVHVLFCANGRRYQLPAESQCQAFSTRLKTLKGVQAKEMAKIGKHLAHSLPSGPIAGTLVRSAFMPHDAPYHPVPLGAVNAETVTLRWEGIVAGELKLRIRERDTYRSIITPSVVVLSEGAHEFHTPTLAPGVWYEWSVSGNGHVCGGVIRRISKSELAELAEMEQEAALARQSAPDDPTPDLLLAESYITLGLFDKAREACAAAQKLSADDAGLTALRSQIPQN